MWKLPMSNRLAKLVLYIVTSQFHFEQYQKYVTSLYKIPTGFDRCGTRIKIRYEDTPAWCNTYPPHTYLPTVHNH